MQMIKNSIVSPKRELIRFLKTQNYEFVTTTPLTHQRVIGRQAESQTLRDAFGWNRPFAQGLLPDAVFETLRNGELIAPVDNAWRSRVRASCVGADLFLHSGYPTTEADAVFLGPDTYRFCRLIRDTLSRRETPVHRALDIGCGTGAGGVAIARSTRCEDLTWSDISERALDFCAANLQEAGFSDPRIVKSDLFARLDDDFDLIVANPPYLNDPLQRAYRHGGGDLGSQLSVRIAVESLPRLAQGGTLILYTGSPIVDGRDRFKADIEARLSSASVRWTYEEIDPDVFGEELELPNYNGVDRIAVVALVATKTQDV